MKFYIYSVFGDELPLACILESEGSEVVCTIQTPSYGNICEGILNKKDPESWEKEITPEDIIIFGSNTREGCEVADRLRERGCSKIIHGSDFGFKLEHDRAYGMQLLKDAGVKIPDTYAFKSNKDAIAFLLDNEGHYYYKPSKEDSASEDTYEGKTTADLIEFIRRQPEQDFIIQRYVEDGIAEVGCEVYFSGGNPMLAPSHTIETKRFGAGNTGSNTGCMSSVSWFDDSFDNPTMDQTWKKLFSIFKEMNYQGACDLSGIVSKSGEFSALEFTTRFGYSQEWALFQCLNQSITSLMISIASGEGVEMERTPEYFGLCARTSFLPYPQEEKKGIEKEFRTIVSKTAGQEITYTEHEGINYYFIDVMQKDGKLMTAGADGIICEVATKDLGIMTGQERVHEACKDIHVGNLYWRTDMFEDAFSGIAKLKEAGFWGSSKL